MKKSVQISERRFWELVEVSNLKKWSQKRHRGNNKGGSRCMMNLVYDNNHITPEEIDSFRYMIADKTAELMDRLHSWSKEHSDGQYDYLLPPEWIEADSNLAISEDTWHNACDHIVGLGRDIYDNVMNQPVTLYDYFDTPVDMITACSLSEIAFSADEELQINIKNEDYKNRILEHKQEIVDDIVNRLEAEYDELSDDLEGNIEQIEKIGDTDYIEDEDIEDYISDFSPFGSAEDTENFVESDEYSETVEAIRDSVYKNERYQKLMDEIESVKEYIANNSES